MEAGGITQHIGAFLGMIQVYARVCKAIFCILHGGLTCWQFIGENVAAYTVYM